MPHPPHTLEYPKAPPSRRKEQVPPPGHLGQSECSRPTGGAQGKSGGQLDRPSEDEADQRITFKVFLNF